jgi:hypothetical protein
MTKEQRNTEGSYMSKMINRMFFREGFKREGNKKQCLKYHYWRVGKLVLYCAWRFAACVITVVCLCAMLCCPDGRIYGSNDIQDDHKVSVQLTITAQKTRKNIFNSFNHLP